MVNWGVDGLNKKEKGLMDMDHSVVIGGRGILLEVLVGRQKSSTNFQELTVVTKGDRLSAHDILYPLMRTYYIIVLVKKYLVDCNFCVLEFANMLELTGLISDGAGTSLLV